MFRKFAVAAILSLTAITAQAADSVPTRVHNAAVAACAKESSASLPVSHYAAITDYCVQRVSTAAMRKLQVMELAKTQASTAALN